MAVYTAAMRPPVDQLSGRRAILERHTTHPGFSALLALVDERLVGFCYGFPGRPGQWWHDVVSNGLATSMPDEADNWLGDSFELAEIHVLPEYQGRGIGRELMTSLCEGRTEQTVVLSTADVESPARRLYRSLGFVDLITAFRFPGGIEDYAVMGSRLPLKPR
ncbi:MAG: GNAT family N-acetyltransferase [Streptosporangiales bacterium]|nr:GNAT family N-acetyltransferase [Streptosporangiales bacterium]